MNQIEQLMELADEYAENAAWDRSTDDSDKQRSALRAAIEQALTPGEPVAWLELCRRLYVELWHCDQQMTHTYDEEGEQMWTTGKTVSDVLRDAKAALDTTTPAPQPQPKQERLNG